MDGIQILSKQHFLLIKYNDKGICTYSLPIDECLDIGESSISVSGLYRKDSRRWGNAGRTRPDVPDGEDSFSVDSSWVSNLAIDNIS